MTTHREEWIMIFVFASAPLLVCFASFARRFSFSSSIRRWHHRKPESGKVESHSLSLSLCSFASPPRLFVQRWNREFVGPEVDHRVSLKLPFSVRLCLVGRGGEGSQLGKYLSALSIPLSNPIPHPPFYPRNPLSLHALMCHSALLDN